MHSQLTTTTPTTITLNTPLTSTEQMIIHKALFYGIGPIMTEIDPLNQALRG